LSADQPILIFGYGNPGCGDDAVGPDLIERIAAMQLQGVACITDMQLQVEHVIDMENRDLILFIDADASCADPFHFSEIGAEKDGSYTSHAMTPHALLQAYQQVYGCHSPPCFLLRIRGYQFELGDAYSAQTTANLNAATHLTQQLCSNPDIGQWRALLTA